MTIELSIQEAESVAKRALDLAVPPASWDAVPSVMKLQVIAGTINIVNALQLLGYRVSRPLKEV
jgi:hypothetical protein